MKNTSTIPTSDFSMKIYGSELQQASLYAFSYDYHDTIMNKASTRYSNDYIFSRSIEIEVHQIYLIISGDTCKERATSKVISVFRIV
jgi:hypothetical protein